MKSNYCIFKSTSALNELSRVADNGVTIPKKVPGTGKRYATEIWIDARDMTNYHYATNKNPAMTVALNEFDKYFHTSVNYEYLEPGMHTTLRIKQVQHIATERFMDYDLHNRKCRLPHENPGI